MISIDENKTVHYLNENNSYFFWENKKIKCFNYYMIKKYNKFFFINQNRYCYFNKDKKIIKIGKVKK